MDLLSNGYYLLSLLSGLKNNKDKNIIIDPLSCLIKLNILQYYPIGTKIGINDNSVSINDPSMLQGALRFIKGDGREDLHNLYIPIIKSIEWYWDDTNPEINNLFEGAIAGLNNLKQAYPINSTITHTLDLYIYHLTTKTTRGFNNKEIKYIETTENNNAIHDFIRTLWSQREIHIIIQLILEYDKTFKNNIIEKQMLTSIFELTTAKEIKLREFLKKHFASL